MSETECQVLNVERLMEHVGADQTLLQELAGLFEDYSPEQMQSLRDSLDAGDCSAIRETAHQFKGALANFFASSAVEDARELEVAGRDNRLEDARNIFARLEGNVQLVSESLTQLCSEAD